MHRRLWSYLAGAAAAVTLAARPAAAQCSAGYTQVSYAATFGCYRFSSFGSWLDTRAEAVSLGGHLAAIGSAEENAAVYGWATSLGRTTFFIGLSDAAAEGVWTWVNGEPVVYTNWRGGEPNNVGDEDGTRVEGSVWNDVPIAGFGDVGVVEQEIAAVPEPATVALLAGGLLALAGARLRRRG